MPAGPEWSHHNIGDLTNVTEVGAAVGKVLGVSSVDGDGTAQWEPVNAGASGASGLIHETTPIAFNTAGLVAGVAVYTPIVNEVLIAAWIEVTTAWNGSSPLGDIGTFVGSTLGILWPLTSLSGVDMTTADGETLGAGLLVSGHYGTQINRPPLPPFRFTATNPLKVCVSTTGATDGASPGANQGAAVVHVLVQPAP